MQLDTVFLSCAGSDQTALTVMQLDTVVVQHSACTTEHAALLTYTVTGCLTELN
jgi:hypothetical protein